MRFKKVLLTAVLCSVMASMYSGCGKKNVIDDSKIDPNSMDKKITISWMGPPYNPSAQEGTFPEKYLESKFNVDIKPIFLSQQNFNDKKAMMMAGGEKIDVVYELDPSNVKQDVDQALICELPYETIKKYAPTVYEQINKEAPNAWLYSRVEDKNYGIPNINYINAYPKFGLWRLDWLKNVGISKVPETLEEMHQALYKFTYEDPDKNNKKDTYGMTGDIKNWHTMFTDIFGAYGVLPFNWMKVDGKPVYGGLQPGTKQALELLAKWYKEGLIHPDFITDDAWQSGKDKFINGIVGFTNANGGYFDPNDVTSIPNAMKKINPNAEVINCKPVKGPDGKMGKHVWGKPCHIISFGAHVAQEPTKLVRVLRILEAIETDEDLAVKIHLGEKDKHWQYKDPARGLDGGVKFLYPYDDSTQLSNECLTSSFGSPSFFSIVTPTYEVYQKYTQREVKDAYNEYADPSFGMSDIFMKPDTLPSSAKYFADLRNKQINTMVKIIVGEQGIDYYSEFENTWKTQGGATLEKEALQMEQTLDTIQKEVVGQK